MQRIRPWLLVGAYRETLDDDLLAQTQVGALLHLVAPVEPSGITTLYLPVEDGDALDADVIRRGVDFVLSQRTAEKRVLIACGAGISRSTTFAIAALKEAEGMALLDAARAVRQAHPAGMPHWLLWESLCAYYGEPHDYRVLL
jgi:protein-tyrosine phosphatase